MQPRKSQTGLTIAAIGIVFGDIGTSPLYTLKTVFAMMGGELSPERILGVLSLIVWTLIIITTIKYVALAMSITNDGEGGILALMSLLRAKPGSVRWLIYVGLFGAALIYGDGAITPAISVLSALEGLDIAAPGLAPYVLPAAAIILFALFAVQPFGTARIGAAFGPVMLCWFAVIGALGIKGIFDYPSVLIALNPWHAISFLASGGISSFVILGGVFLCATGAEALYADMGHFGSSPIRRAWFWVVFPSLFLSYAGQSAIALAGSPIDEVFYRLCPSTLLLPLIVLSTFATIR